MTQYRVLLSDEAWDDLERLLLVIAKDYKSPLTAQRYIAAVWDKILKLQNFAGSIALYSHSGLQQRYGRSLRRINYKQIAILYTLESSDTVLIVRIIPGSIIA
jgi:plasmid stabilization system protein ParE